MLTAATKMFDKLSLSLTVLTIVPSSSIHVQPRDGVGVQRQRETQSTEENERRDHVEYDPPSGGGEKSLQRIEQKPYPEPVLQERR